MLGDGANEAHKLKSKVVNYLMKRNGAFIPRRRRESGEQNVWRTPAEDA
jgi:hypothetical protein